MTRAKPVIAAKRKKRSPRCIGNDLGQMLTHSQFTNRSVLSQEVRGCYRGRRVERAPAFQADTGQGYGRGGTSHLPQVRQDRSKQVRERRCLRREPAAGRDGGALFAPELAESRKSAKKDAHRLTCRISARLETADYEALQRLIEAEGYATTQDWLTATVRRYITEAGETE